MANPQKNQNQQQNEDCNQNNSCNISQNEAANKNESNNKKNNPSPADPNQEGEEANINKKDVFKRAGKDDEYADTFRQNKANDRTNQNREPADLSERPGNE
ncbi:MAG: hypothetical protein EB060_04520 [Proteobacteria bacterium]|nr:hypothetical protein [Pseudomonadota bacterium]